MKWKLFLFHLDLWLGLYVNWIQAQIITNDLVFLDSQGFPIETVEAKENDTFELSCSSKSSNKLELLCNEGIKHKTFKDIKSKVEITADRLSHGKKCSCHDIHSVEKYITLNVIYHAEISNFNLMRGAGTVINKSLDENTRFKVKCEATGNPPPLLQLIHQNESRVANVLNQTTGHSIEYSGIASCGLAGLFTCVASNNLKTVNSSREIILQVECPLKSCESSKDLVYRVPLMKIFQLQICLLHYIEGLYEVTIHKLVNNDVTTVQYPITFTYTTPTRLRGDFTLTLNLTTQNDYGNYFLRIEKKQWTSYSLYFTLQQLETPQCPTNLSIIPEGKNFLLSWMDGDDGGSKQTFVVLQAVSNNEFTEVGRINDTLGNITTYNVAGLEPNTTYIFSVNVYNNIGTLNCSNLTVSISTAADSRRDKESTQKEDNIIIIIVCVILGFSVVVPVICFARRHHIKSYGSGEIEKSKLEMKETPNDLYDFDPALPPDSNVKNLSNEESVSKLVEVEREKKALISTNNDTKTSNSTEQNVYGNMDENKPRHNSMDTSGALIQVL